MRSERGCRGFGEGPEWVPSGFGVGPEWARDGFGLGLGGAEFGR
jgi:hypothetical protein